MNVAKHVTVAKTSEPFPLLILTGIGHTRQSQAESGTETIHLLCSDKIQVYLVSDGYGSSSNVDRGGCIDRLRGESETINSCSTSNPFYDFNNRDAHPPGNRYGTPSYERQKRSFIEFYYLVGKFVVNPPGPCSGPVAILKASIPLCRKHNSIHMIHIQPSVIQPKKQNKGNASIGVLYL